MGNVRETLDANADEYGEAPATQLRIDDDEGGQGELGMTTACKTLAAYGYDAYQQLSIAEMQREMPRGIPARDSRRADHLGRIRRSLQQQFASSSTVRRRQLSKCRR